MHNDLFSRCIRCVGCFELLCVCLFQRIERSSDNRVGFGDAQRVPCLWLPRAEGDDVVFLLNFFEVLPFVSMKICFQNRVDLWPKASSADSDARLVLLHHDTA
jgi:hypothetical protein